MHIMNNECLDIFNYISSTQFKEKHILFEYFFDRKFRNIISLC